MDAEKKINAVVFCGPSITSTEAMEILPGAKYFPPARQSDFLSIVASEKPNVIGLIDGEFDQSLAVWHKEILFALSKGVRVYGSSSMGAIRAAECQKFGMIPIGDIAACYTKGVTTDDDEVALCYEQGTYRKISHPMVNIRRTIWRILGKGIITGKQAVAMEKIAKELHYSQRRIETICNGFCTPEQFREHYCDQKRIDAIQLLQEISELTEILDEPNFRFESTNLFEAQYSRDRWVRRKTGIVEQCFIEGEAILEDQQLWKDAMNRGLALRMCEQLNIDPDINEISAESTSFIRRMGMEVNFQFEQWLIDNDMTGEEFVILMKEQAMIRKLHQSLKTTLVHKKTTRLVLDHLKLIGRYSQVADDAAMCESMKPDYASKATVSDLVRDHTPKNGLDGDEKIMDYLANSGYESPQEIRIDLIRKLARKKK